MYRSIAAVLVLLTGLTGMPGGARSQTLEEALEAAFNNNPTLLAERAKLRAIDENVAQALSNWRPTVEMVGDYAGRATESNLVTNRRQHRDPRSLSFTVEQSLYRGGRTLAATSEAENTVRAGRARLIAVEQNVLRDAATAYMNVVRDQAVLELTTNKSSIATSRRRATASRSARSHAPTSTRPRPAWPAPVPTASRRKATSRLSVPPTATWSAKTPADWPR